MFINEINYLVAEAKRAFEQMHFREASMFTFSLLINARNKYRQECQALGEVRCRMIMWAVLGCFHAALSSPMR